MRFFGGVLILLSKKLASLQSTKYSIRMSFYLTFCYFSLISLILKPLSFVVDATNLNFVTLPKISKYVPAYDFFLRDLILYSRVFYWLVRLFLILPSTFTTCIYDFLTNYWILFISTCSWWKYICIWCDSFLNYISALFT